MAKKPPSTAMTKSGKPFQPLPPMFKFAQGGKWMYVHALIHIGPGQMLSLRSKTDLEDIERRMRAGEEVGGLFGSIFKGIKKAVSTVGKATGLNKVVSLGMKVLDNPILKTAFPLAGVASAGLKVSKNLITSMAAKDAGKPQVASKALAMSAAIAQKSGLDSFGAARAAEQTYHLILTHK